MPHHICAYIKLTGNSKHLYPVHSVATKKKMNKKINDSLNLISSQLRIYYLYI